MLVLCFNKKLYSIPEEYYKYICDGFKYNEPIDADEEKWVISFLTNSIVKKSYEDLDLHEFVIEGSFRESVLLCHIENIFGRDKADIYACHIDSNWDSTDYVSALSAREAIYHASCVFSSDEMPRFKKLLSTLFLFDIAKEDYEQGVEDFATYNRDIVFINGIGYRKKKYNGGTLLEPLIQRFQVDYQEYKEIKNIYAPPVLMSSLFGTYASCDEAAYTIYNEKLDLFLLKLEQCCGTIPQYTEKIDLSNKPLEHLDKRLIGKWYYISKSTDSFVAFNCFRIYDFLPDGIYRLSVAFFYTKADLKENFANSTERWYTEDNVLFIEDKGTHSISKYNYRVEGDYLFIGDHKYYRNREEIESLV